MNGLMRGWGVVHEMGWDGVGVWHGYALQAGLWM